MNHIIKNKIKDVVVLFTMMLIASCSDQEKDFTGEPLVTYPDVTVTSVSPSTGTSGNVVTLTGTNFGNYQQAAKIYFNGVLADEILSYTDTSVTVRVPQNAGTGSIKVKVWTNTFETASFEYLTGGTISNISPTSGNVGDQIVITGQGFGTDPSKVSVKFTDGITKYDARVGTVVSVSDTQIVVLIPKGAVTGKVRVWLENQIITGPELTVVAPPKGKYIFEFDDPTDPQWLPAQNATYVIEDGKLKVTFNPTQLGTSASKRRADLYTIMNGVFPSPGGAVKAKWVQSPAYPIFAMKIAFTGTAAPKPGTGNIVIDPIPAGANQGNNKYKTDYLAQNVIYYDLSADYLTETELTTRQLKIADIVGPETGYEVDWIRTFKTKEELKAFLGL